MLSQDNIRQPEINFTIGIIVILIGLQNIELCNLKLPKKGYNLRNNLFIFKMLSFSIICQ